MALKLLNLDIGDVMKKRIIPAMIGLAGTVSLIGAVSGTLQKFRALPLMSGLLILIVIYWVLINIIIYKKADKSPLMTLWFVLPGALVAIIIGSLTFMRLDRPIRDMANILGLAILGGAMITGATFLWNRLFPEN